MQHYNIKLCFRGTDADSLDDTWITGNDGGPISEEVDQKTETVWQRRLVSGETQKLHVHVL